MQRTGAEAMADIGAPTEAEAVTSSVDGSACKPDRECMESNLPKGWACLNADKTVTQLVQTSALTWDETSAGSGVFRKKIERLGMKDARATTLVKFGPGMSFPEHSHWGGEEFIVLRGTWSDAFGDFPEHLYIRNYIGSKHSPSMGGQGVLILVRLGQMSRQHPEPEHKSWQVSPEVCLAQGRKITFPQDTGDKEPPTIARLDVFQSPLEQVSFQMWPANTKIPYQTPENGAEIFVMGGGFESGLGVHDQHSWVRMAQSGEMLVARTGPEGAYVYVKEGHLNSDEVGAGES